MNRSPTGWFRHLSISQKFLVSFGLILSLLALSLTALLFILTHRRIGKTPISLAIVAPFTMMPRVRIGVLDEPTPFAKSADH